MVELEGVRLLMQPFIAVFSALIVSGAASSVAIQILKGDWFPLLISKYPRAANIIVSFIASVISIYTSGINLVLQTVFDYGAFIIGVTLLSAFTYKNILKGTSTKDGKSQEAIA